MAIVEGQKIKVIWNSASSKHYIEKGYPKLKNGEFFFVNVDDLSKGSNKKVKLICDHCKKSCEKMYVDIYGKYNHYCTYKCKQEAIKNGKEKKESHRNKGVSIDTIRSFISNNFEGYILLSKEYVKNSAKLQIECNSGHLWEVAWNSLLKSKKGCPKCSGNIKYTIEEVREIFQKRNCELLEYEYYTSNTPMKYRCECGNISSNSLNKFLKNKKGCRKCSQKEEGFKSKEYSKDFLISEFWRYKEEFGKYPTTQDLAKNNVYPSPSHYYKKFDNYTIFLSEVVSVLGEHGWYKCDESVIKKYYPRGSQEEILSKLMIPRLWSAVVAKARKMSIKRNIHSSGRFIETNESIISKFWKFVKTEGKYPTTSAEFASKDYCPSLDTIRRRFNSWENYLIEVGVCRSTGFKNWYLYEEKILKKYYPLGEINLILKLLPHKTKFSIVDKANQLKLKINKDIRYKRKYKNNEELVNSIKIFVINYYKNENKAPAIKDIPYQRLAIRENWKSYNDLMLDCNVPLPREVTVVNSKKEAIVFLNNLRKKIGKNPTIDEAISHGVPKSWFDSNFGGFKKALYFSGLISEEEAFQNVKVDSTIKIIHKWKEDNKKIPTVYELKEYLKGRKRYFDPIVLMNKLGFKSYQELCLYLFGESNTPIYNKEDMIKELIDLKDKIGRVPMGKELKINGLYSSDIYKYVFKKQYFNDIIRELGWKPFGHDPVYKSNEELLEDYSSIYVKLGRLPTRGDLVEEDRVAGWDTYISRFDSMKNVCKLLDIEYEENILDRELGLGISCFDKNGDLCRSIKEMTISNILIDNGLKFKKEIPYKEAISSDATKRSFDWFIPEYNVYIEYFGLYSLNSKTNKVVKIYTDKANKKIDDCIINNVSLISLMPSDLRNSCEGIYEKFSEKGIELTI